MSVRLSRRAAIAGLASLSAGVLAAPHVARAAVQTVRLGHNNTAMSHYGQGAAAFAAAVAADPVLSGTLRIEVHGNSELGDELGMLKNVSRGTLDMMLCSNTVIGNVVPQFGYLDAPFLFRDVTHARAVLDGPVGAKFAAAAVSKNLVVLAWAENGLRHITANRPIRTPADLHGLKIRVPQSEVMLGGLRALGADANTLSFDLVRDALRSGQFQAQENPIVVIEAARLYELQKDLSLTGHIYDPAVLFASSDLTDDLSAAQRAALMLHARDAGAITRKVADAAQHDGIARLAAKGMTVVSDVDIAAFRAASRPYLQALAEKSTEVTLLMTAAA